jgi:hypothetical protein
MRINTRRLMHGMRSVIFSIPICGVFAAVNMYAATDNHDDPAPLLNPGFESGADASLPADWAAPEIPGYATRASEDHPLEGIQCATMICESEAAGRFGNLVQRIDAAAYRSKRVRFRAAVRTGRGSGEARLWLRVDRKTADGTPAMGAFDNMGDRPIASSKWAHYEIVANVAEDADRISVGMMFSGPGQAWIDDASVEIVGTDIVVTARSPQGPVGSGPAQAEVKPGLFEILGAMVIAPAAKTEQATSGRDPDTVMREQDVLIPLPLAYRDQTPLSFELFVTPPASAIAADIFRDGANNAVLKVTLADGRRGPVKVTFRSVLLIGPSDFTSVPEKAPLLETWPEDVSTWLASTWCAEASHQRISHMAAGIRAETDDVLEIVGKVQEATGNVLRLAQGRGDSLTAVEALDKQGSCTSCANLVAALLRACGVPARIVAGYPSWSGPLQTHYIVEAYFPGYGWYPIESTMGQSPWPNFQQAQVAIIPPQYEEKVMAGARVGIAAGVPYLSLTELPGNDGSCIAVGALENATGCDHHCRAIRSLEGTHRQWKRAAAATRSEWEAWLDESLQFNAAGELRFGDPPDAQEWSSVAELLKGLER